jgi:geranylgeranyl diphosphate synthase type 3
MDNNNDECFDEKILEPLYYLTKIPGKKIRTKLIKSFNHWVNIPEDVLNNITDIIETLHNSSLLIDDIEDNSQLRRGVPVAHSVFGVPLTINAANYAYFIALKKVIELNNDKAIKIFSGMTIINYFKA